MEFITRTTRLSVLPKGAPIFSERCTNISIVDEAAGEFLEIEQQSCSLYTKKQTITIEATEWPALKGAIDNLLDDINKYREVRE